MRHIEFDRGPLRFRAIDSGPEDGPPVVLLHGFPQRSSSWGRVIEFLHAAGLRTITLDQRGYCETARPKRRRDYRLPDLADDVLALLDAAGLESAHIVGHDWGAAVAWQLAAHHPERVSTLTAVSVPHPAAFFRAMITSDQALRSWYIGFFQIPWLPEKLLGSPGDAASKALRRTGMSSDMVETFRREMVATGAIPGGLGWYRAIPLTDPRTVAPKVRVPTTYVWSDGDPALGRGGARLTQKFVTGDYRYVELKSVSHWIPDEQPKLLAAAIVDRVTREPDQESGEWLMAWPE